MCLVFDVLRDAFLRDGGLGRGLERLEEANSSVRVGRGFGFGVVGTGSPFALPRPLPRETGVTGAVGKEETGGVEGGTAPEPLEAGSCTAACGMASVRAFLLGGLRAATGEMFIPTVSGD